MDKHAPIKKLKIKADTPFREPWLTVKLKRYNQKCRKLCNKARVSGLEIDFIKYKQYHNTLNRLKLHEKRVHYSDLFQKIRKNAKLLWNVVNNLLKKSNNRTEVTKLLCNKNLITDSSEICNAFNAHFVTAGQRVQNSIIKGSSADVNECETVDYIRESMTLPCVTEGQICKIVQNMKSKNSSGLDGISNTLLKQIISVIKMPLCVIFNKSLSSGIFPDLMKIAKVLPLHKIGTVTNPDNYRPISLLPVISKVLEKIIYNATVSHLDAHDILYSRQYGFRRNHSTSDAILNLTGDVLEAFERGHMMLAVFIDLKKAFDSVCFNSILCKLEKLGIRNEMYNWFHSYLTGRRQCVTLNGAKSNFREVCCGVPQGSLLGVFLFQIEINYIFKSLKFTTAVLYADDTTLYVSGNSLKFLKLKMQQDLHTLAEWLKRNCLKLNVAKTKTLLFHKEGLAPNYLLNVDGECI